jgi:WD40 repeat protein
MTWALQVTSELGRGTGVAISPTLVLTAEHVGRGATAVQVRATSGKTITFSALLSDQDAALDVALLSCPAATGGIDAQSVVVPRLLWRGHWPGDESQAWAESCTSESDTPRRMDVSVQRGHRDDARVQFVVEHDRQGVRHGHSGGPLLDLDAVQGAPRLVGVVRARDGTTVDPLDNAGVGWFVPIDVIAARFEVVRDLVESPVERDPAWARHWEPRSRGVATAREKGHYYAGYHRAYERLCAHLEQGSGLMVVTGSRGRGKSALLARVVVLSCRRYRTLLADSRALAGYQSLVSVVDAAVFSRGKSTDEVAEEIAHQLGLGGRVATEVVAALAIAESDVSIVIDAVDESDDPRGLVAELVLPLTDAGAQVVIGGLRRHVASTVSSDAEWLDLDGRYADESAVEGYVQLRLRELDGYPPTAVASVAHAVAARAVGNFLVAELVTRTLKRVQPIDTTQAGWQKQLPTNVGEAFREYLARFGGARDQMLALLHPLARALGDGLTIEPDTIWLQTANALPPDLVDTLHHADLVDANRRAGDYLITDPSPSGARRLFHEGLGEAIRTQLAQDALIERGQEPTGDAIEMYDQDHAARFVDCLVSLLPDPGAPLEEYGRLDPYLLRHLPTHLAEHGRIGEMLERPGLLLTCDLPSVRRALVRGALSVSPEHEPIRVAAVYALAIDGDASERAAALCAALTRQRARPLAERTRGAGGPLKYELVFGPALPSMLTTVQRAHDGHINAVVAAADDVGTVVVSSGGSDDMLRSWRLDGTPGPLPATQSEISVEGLVLAADDVGTLLVSAIDGELRSWRLDGTTGPLRVDDPNTLGIAALASTADDEGAILVGGDHIGAVRSWRLDGTAGPLTIDHAHDSIETLAIAEDGVGTMVISGGSDGALRSWRLDGTPGPLAVEDAHSGGVYALAVAADDVGPVVASGGFDGALRSWRLDGAPGPLIVEDLHGGWVKALAVVADDAGPILVSGGFDATLRSWRLNGTRSTLTVEHAHSGGIEALATAPGDSGVVVVSGGSDGALSSWRLNDACGPHVPTGADNHSGGVWALAVAADDAGSLLVSGGRDGALRSCRLDGTPGQMAVADAHDGGIIRLALTADDAGPLLISAGLDGALRSWRLDGTPGQMAVADAHDGAIAALASAVDNAGVLLLSGGRDGALHSWRSGGTPGPLNVAGCAGTDDPDDIDGVENIPVRALAMATDDVGMVALIGYDDGALRSYRLDGTPGPLNVESAHSNAIDALVVVTDEFGTLLLSGGIDGALRSWRLDGQPGPLNIEDTQSDLVWALAAAIDREGVVVFTGGSNGALRSWRLDGTPGPLTVDDAHGGGIGVLAVATDSHGAVLLSGGGNDGTVLRYQLSPDAVPAGTARKYHP